MAKKRAKAGQPTKYKPVFCRKIIEVFSAEPYEDVKLEHFDVKTDKVKWVDKKRMPRKLPTLVGFAKSIKVNYRTVYAWQDENCGSYQEEFSQVLMRAKELQKDFLIQNGLQGLYNPIFSKFVATIITDMKDKQEFDIGAAASFANLLKLIPSDD